jgi:sulfur carrier protein
MEVTVNKQTYSVSEVCSLRQMLNTVFQQIGTGIAIAVNQEIISKNDWGHHLLKPGDTITIIKATQGG